MNWQIFSTFGYLGAALSLAVPLLWLFYWRGQKPAIRYAAAVLSIVALVCAKVNSTTHVNRIETIPSSLPTQKQSREEEIRKAALEGRGSEVAQITFAEDSAGEFLDKAGMDEADLKYLGGDDESSSPEWKRQKQSRTREAGKEASPEDKLSSQISGPESPAGIDVAIPEESSKPPPARMSEADVARAHRVDRWNLGFSKLLILATVMLLAIDYLRRANQYGLASMPLPLPSAWLNAFTPMPPVVVRPQPARRTVTAELVWLARRGDPFVYLTDSPADADAALAHLESLPPRRRPHVLRVTDDITDEFVFESLWFARGSFIVDSAARAERLLASFRGLLEQRRSTRAKTGQTAHMVWHVNTPIPQETRDFLSKLAKATGFSILLT